jgi:hypothetical protein
MKYIADLGLERGELDMRRLYKRHPTRDNTSKIREIQSFVISIATIAYPTIAGGVTKQ